MNLSMIRPYEMSLWTLQDSFITVLKGINTSSQGQLITPEISIKSDGTQELKFSIPMYYRNELGEMVENPIWYNTRNGNLMVNLRKVKVIFNKGEKGVEGVYEFVINKIKETHSQGQLICEVEAEGLAFQELGKTGYKLVLNYDEFLIDAEKWEESEENKDKQTSDNFLATLNYWAKKVFKNTNWTYSIQMDWSAYDGFIDDVNYENLSQDQKDEINNSRENKKLRRRDKVYEEGYVVSWNYDTFTNTLTPFEIKNFQEKARIPEIEKSNRYNITQTLAELFGVFCKYKYSYDDNYHITGRECIFYNNFFGEDLGKIDINYPYNTNEIIREGESTDVITKMYVVPLDDIGIQDVPANKSGEDYILNFDYLYEIGTISDEQYKEIEKYEGEMFYLNFQAREKAEEKIKLEQDLNILDADLAVASKSLIHAEEQINSAKQAKTALIEGRDGEIFEKNKINPQQIYLYDEGGSFGVRSLGLEGIDVNSIKIYASYSLAGGIPDDSKQIYFNPEEHAVYDKTTKKNLEGISGLRYYKNLENENGEANLGDPITKPMKAYMTCIYSPGSKYDNIIDKYEDRAREDSKKIDSLKADITKLEESIEDLNLKLEGFYLEQEKKRTNFESMMGPALREGSWQAEEYSDSGDKYYVEISIGQTNKEKLIRGFWDSELFDEENYNYETVSITEDKDYFPTIDLTQILSSIQKQIGQDFLCIRYDKPIAEGKTETYDISISSQMQYGFLNKQETITPILYITKDLTNTELEAIKQTGRIGYLTYTYNEETGDIEQQEGTTKTFVSLFSFNGVDYFIDENSLSEYELVYPRFEIDSENLRTEDEELSVKILEKIISNGEEAIYSHPIQKYSDYYILYRLSKYYITIQPEVYLRYWGMENFAISYIISNANLRLYLDALEVSKTNAYPQVSYDIAVSALNKDLIKTIYKDLNRIVSINDSELKFKNVQGYISELNLKLESPWDDEIVVQNYKTKFEDLFSRIVASTEALKTNAMIYNRAASAFTTSGLLTSEVIQSSLSRVDLNYAFNNGKLTINEREGIWGISDSGVVAFRGGGIFCATEQDFDGNWIWHTGIVPEGINASLLTAGVIDTNVIRIFAGDNIRFQMNAEGLYSFKEYEDSGETNFNDYLVQNSEGLFLIKKNLDYKEENGNKVTVTNIIKRVEISWDGLILRDDEGNNLFYVDPNTGNLVANQIQANTGLIGGWIIGENHLLSREQVFLLQKDEEGNIKYDEDGNPVFGDVKKERQVGFGSSTQKDDNVIEETEVYDAIWAGRIIEYLDDGTEIREDAFVVKSDGTVNAKLINADFIRADKAAIGGVFISDVISQINTLKIEPVSGEFFKWEREKEVPENQVLKFVILEGPYKNIQSSSWEIQRRAHDSETWEDLPDTEPPIYNLNVENLTFDITYDIMNFGEGDEKIKKDVVHIKLCAINEGEDGSLQEVESEVFTLYNIFDGEDGVINDVNILASDLTFYFNEELNKYTPDSIILTAELHGYYTKEYGKWIAQDNPDTVLSNTLKYEVFPDSFSGSRTFVYRYQISESEYKDYSISIHKLRNGIDGENPLTVLITSSNGNIFKNKVINTTLTAHLYQGAEEIIEGNYFFRWYKSGDLDEEGKINYLKEGSWEKEGHLLDISSNDVDSRATFNCEVLLEENPNEGEEEV